MTEPESPDSLSEETPASATGGDTPNVEAEPEPKPVPWTAERVAEWNAYYDLYVVLGVLLLAFVTSANKISHSTIWTYLKTGEEIVAKSAPVVTDQFSFTEAGHTWVNIPWLFEVGHAVLFRGAAQLISIDPADPMTSAQRGEQLGAQVLVALTALIRVATVLVLLRIRRPGPGLWWSSLCVTIALASSYSPMGVMFGGIAGPAKVDPSTWGQLLLAVELLLLHKTINLGQRQVAWGLIPLFLIWANVDESFLIGLIVFAATLVGRLASASKADVDPLPTKRGFAILGGCVAIALVNPSFYRVYPAALAPITQLFQADLGTLTMEQLSYFGKGIRELVGSKALQTALQAYYVLAVGLGLASFALNRRHFSPGRFAAFAVVAVLWGVLVRYNSEFAILLAATLALNGQEWYHDRFGTKGRLGNGWALWSTGGRFLTILLVFAFVAQCLTGYGRSFGDSQFGFGYNRDAFSFEAAEYLRSADIAGNVLNTSLQQGDSIIWKGYPKRKTYVDSRHNLFPPEIQQDLQEVRRALSEDDVARWKGHLDKYEISAVMIHPQTAPKTYRRLMQSLNWIPFYDDGNVVMFGRSDAAATDVAHFKKNRLDPEALAYRQTKPVPPGDGYPTPPSKLDNIYWNRFLDSPQPHTESARRWLQGLDFDPNTATLPSPARCYKAIQEARIALSRKPDDTQAYRLLSSAYRSLMIQENGILAGQSPDSSDPNRPRQSQPRANLLMNRLRQRVTSLNYAIQTTPPPQVQVARVDLFQLTYELYQLYLGAGYLDLARDRLESMLAVTKPGDLPEDFRSQLTQELGRMDEQLAQIQERMDEMVDEQQIGPLQRAEFALSQGALRIAIKELDDALQINVNPTIVTPRLLDLYCDTGQPEKALDLLAKSSNVDDPNFGSEPGTSALRQGRVYFLLGNYEYAATLWQTNAIQRISFERTLSTLNAGRAMIRGDAKSSTSVLESIPTKIATQATWEFDLASCRLESGEPTKAAESFAQALKLAPELPTRLIAAYYLEKLGQTVPPKPEAATEEPPLTVSPSDVSSEPAEKAEEKKPDPTPPAEKPEAKKTEETKPEEKKPEPAPAPEKAEEKKAEEKKPEPTPPAEKPEEKKAEEKKPDPAPPVEKPEEKKPEATPAPSDATPKP
ncbi:tetratricopeptide repeat protein [Singulisphaera rosea]